MLPNNVCYPNNLLIKMFIEDDRGAYVTQVSSD